jgi:hypothetical protein
MQATTQLPVLRARHVLVPEVVTPRTVAEPRVVVARRRAGGRRWAPATAYLSTLSLAPGVLVDCYG